MSDFDTLRWGDSDSLTFFTATSPSNITVQKTKQLVHAYWRRPLTWKVLVYVVPQLPAAESGTFTATLLAVIGIGQSVSPLIAIPITVAPTAGVYAPVMQTFDLPAQDIQLQFALDASAATQEEAPEFWNFAAFAAPLTEPQGYTVVGDMLAGPDGARDQTRRMPDQFAEPRWMPPGFQDGTLRYRR